MAKPRWRFLSRRSAASTPRQSPLHIEAFEQRLLLSASIWQLDTSAVQDGVAATTSVLHDAGDIAATAGGSAQDGQAAQLQLTMSFFDSTLSAPSQLSLRVGDVLSLDLKQLHQAASKAPPAAFDPSQIRIAGATLSALGSGEYLVFSDVTSAARQTVYGRLLLGESAGLGPFAATGQAVFVPHLPSEPTEQAFQGELLLGYGATRDLASITVRSSTTPPDHEEWVLGDGSRLDTLRLQQRLRSLDYPGVAGGALVVDGVVGANTRHAIGLFNAAVQGRLQQAVPVDTIDLSWINDPEAPRWRLGGVVDEVERRLSTFEQSSIARLTAAVEGWFDRAAEDAAWALTAPMLEGTLARWLPLASIGRGLIDGALAPLRERVVDSLSQLERLLSERQWSIDVPVLNADGTPGATTMTFSAASGGFVTLQADGQGLTLRTRLVSSAAVPLSLGLDDTATSIGLALRGLNEIAGQRSVSFNFELRILSDPTLAQDRAVVVKALSVDGEIVASVPSLNAAFRIGGFDGAIQNGRIEEFSIRAAAGLLTGNNGSTLAELTASNWGGRFFVQPGEARVKGQLPFVLDVQQFGSTSKLARTVTVDYRQSLADLVPVIDFTQLRFGTGAGVSLPELGSIGINDFLSLLAKFGDWLNGIRVRLGDLPQGFEWPKIALPVLGKLTLPDLRNLLRFGDWLELPRFDLPTTGVPGFSLPSLALPSWQQLIGLLPGFRAGGLTFDVATKTLSYRVAIDRTLAEVPWRLTLNQGQVQGDFTARARLKGEFTIGLDIRPLGAGFTLRGNTLLSSLNGGAGLIRGAVGGGAPDIRLRFADGSSVDVGLSVVTASPSATVDDVMQAIVVAAGGRVAMATRLTDLVSPDSAAWLSLDPLTRAAADDRSRLWLRDLTTGDGIFAVESLNGSLLPLPFVGLGLAAADEDGVDQGDGVIGGVPLHGEVAEDRFFVRFDTSDELKLFLEMDAPDIDAALVAGDLEAGVRDGSALVRAEVSLRLQDPGRPGVELTRLDDGTRVFSVAGLDGRVSLAEMVGSLAMSPDVLRYGSDSGADRSRLEQLFGAVTLAGNAIVDLPLASSIPNLLPATAKVRVDWTDITNPGSLAVTAQGLELAQAARDFAVSAFVDGLRQVQSAIAALEASPVFQQQVPLVGETLASLLQLRERFGEFIVEVERASKDSILNLRQIVEDAAKAISDRRQGTTGSGRIQLDPTRRSFFIDLDFGQEGQSTLPLNTDLAELGRLVDDSRLRGNLLASSGRITAAYKGEVALRLVVDLANSALPVVYVRDSSSIKVGLGLYAGDIDASASLGPLGLYIRDGSIRLDQGGAGGAILDGDSDTTVDFSKLATWTVDVVDVPGASDRWPLFSDFGLSKLAVSSAGRLDAALPIYFPDPHTPLDPLRPQLQLSIANLASPVGSTTLVMPSTSAALASIRDFTETLGDVWLNIGEGWGSTLSALDRLLDDAVFSAAFPLVGKQLRDAVGFLDDLHSRLAPIFEDTSNNDPGIDDLRRSLTDALGAWLAGRGVTVTRPNGATDRVEFTLPLRVEQQVVAAGLDFDLGLPGLGLELSGGVRLDMGFDWSLSFGVSKADGFYLVLPNAVTDDVRLDLRATLPGFNATGTLGFLQVVAKDDARSPSFLQGSLFVDLKDPSGDGRLTLDDLQSGAALSRFVSARFDGEAVIRLDVETSIKGSSDFPRLRFDLDVDWQFDGAATGSPTLGNRPSVKLDNVEVNAGEFLNNTLGPVVRNVQAVLEPLRPAIEVLTSPLPGLSQLAGRPVTLLEVARGFGGGRVDRVVAFVEQVRNVDELVRQFSAIATTGWIPLGKADLPDLDLGRLDVDLRRATGALSSVFAGLDEATFTLAVNARSSADIFGEFASLGAAGIMSVARGPAGFSFPAFEQPSRLLGVLLGRDVDLVLYTTPRFSADLQFILAEIPILPPILFARVQGAVGFEAQFAVGFDTLGLRRFAETSNSGDLLDGFFVADVDVSGADIPEMRLYGEIGVYAALPRLDVSVNLGIVAGGFNVDVYAGGGIRAALLFNLSDPDGDGKVRGTELAANLALGPQYLFDVSGRVDFVLKARAYLGAWAEFNYLLGKVRKSWTVLDLRYEQAIPILSYDMPRPDRAPVLGQVNNGTLQLNVGPRASLRRNGDINDGNESIQLLAGSTPDSVVVAGFGVRQTFTGVRAVFGNMGAGNDSVQVGDGLLLDAIEIRGGDGDDVLVNVGGAAVVFRGGAGNDRLIGGRGADRLHGDAGDDILVGNSGNDSLEGGDGNDQIQGGAGGDVIYGYREDGAGRWSSDDDVIFGDADDDVVYAGPGNDRVVLGAGRDRAWTGAGEDLVDGGTGDDELFGEDGNDRLVGGDGYDLVDGGAGDDFVDGGKGNDRLFGGTGSDLIWGGTGNDTIDAGDGDDTVFGGDDARAVGNVAGVNWGADTIVGGLGNDVLYVGSGSGGLSVAGPSTVHGDRVGDQLLGGNDIIHGGPGDDLIHGGGGADAIYGHGGHDRLIGDGGNDLLDGGTGHDVLIGGAGADQLNAGEGFDVLWGGVELVALDALALRTASDRQDVRVLTLPPEIARSDEMLAFQHPLIMPVALAGLSMRDDLRDAGDEGDTLYGGAERDWIFGGAGNDTLDGGGGEDYLHGGAGSDLLLGSNGADVLRGGDGDDVLRGGNGADLLYGESGNDRLWGDSWNDIQAPTTRDAFFSDGRRQRLYGGEGDDYLFAWSGGLDTFHGDLLGDALYGGAGNDYLLGGLRRDILYGGGGNDVLLGDALAANVELNPQVHAVSGGRDFLYGDEGDDVLLGGGGFDELFGGHGSDRLEGQRGADLLVGGAGSDVMVVDLLEQRFGTHVDRFDGHGDPTVPDGGIDRFLIVGTDGNDRLRLGEALVNQAGLRRLVVSLGNERGEVARAQIDWRIATTDGSLPFNAPLLDQFHIVGLAGSDDIRLAEPGELGPGTVALDLTALAAIGNGWVMVIEGGGGDDVLHGSPHRDYIDGGSGSDRLYGGDGDDQLWGDVGDGYSLDVDQLFGGRGNDDLYAGRGRAEMFAWSLNPYRLDTQGRYVDAQGQPLSNPWDVTQRVWLGVYTEVDAVTGAERPRVGPLPAGAAPEATGLNRVIGGESDDLLFGGRGLDFLYGGGGDNAFFGRLGQPLEALGNIAISAEPDRALEPGDASGYWHYAASNADDIIRVDFVTEPGLLVGRHLITRLTQNGQDFSFDASVRLDFRDNTAGAGGQALWQPTSLLDSARVRNSADVEGLSRGLTRGAELSRASLISTLLPPEDDFLAIFIDAMDGNDEVFVGPTVQKSLWVDAGRGDDSVRIESGNAILIDAADRQGNSYAGRNDSPRTAYRLEDRSRPGGADPALLGRTMVFTGLTLDNPDDLDHFVFRIGQTMPADARLVARSFGPDDRIRVEVFAVSRDTNGVLELVDLNRRATALPLASEAAVSVAGLAAGEYIVRVSDDRKPTRYDLVIDFADGTNPADRPVQLGQVVSLMPRRDLILGGEGNDVLIGGPGEDYIAGGPGDDLLSGGADRQAVDVLDGGEGDDTFQIWTDGLAINRVTGVPITSPGLRSADIFIGGSGNDRALYLGTESPDFAALRYNASDQRYELAARVYDVANQRYVTDANGEPLLEFAFITLRGIEALQVDLRGGDDEFRADPDYRMRGDPEPGREWGIRASARPLGAPVDGLTIFGGTGNDRLFGGAGRDYIDGGDGRDVIVGGSGDDELHGGEGDDLIVGDRLDVLPDAFESGLITGSANDNQADAHLLRLQFDSAGRANIEGSFHAGDGDDWYLLQAPIAPRGYGSIAGDNPDLERVALSPHAVSVETLSGATARVQLYAARVVFDAGGRIVSIDRDVNDQRAAPAYYLVHVSNTTRPGTRPETGTYRLTIDVSSGTASVDASDARQVQRITAPNALNVLVPAGDLNGDGRLDYFATLRVDAARSELRQILGTAPAGSSPWISNPAFLDIGSGAEATVRIGGPAVPGVDYYRTVTLLTGGNFDRWDGRNSSGQIVEDTRDELLWVDAQFVPNPNNNNEFETRTRVWLSKTLSPLGLDPVANRDQLQLVAEFWGAPVAVSTLGDVDQDGFVDAGGTQRAGVRDLGIVAFQGGRAFLHLYSGRGIWTLDGNASRPSAVIDLGPASAPSAWLNGGTSNFRIFDAGDVDGDGRAGDFVVTTSTGTWFLTAGAGWQRAAGALPLNGFPTGSVYSRMAGNAEVFRAGDVDRDGRADFVVVAGDSRDLIRGWAFLQGRAVLPGTTALPATSGGMAWSGAVEVVALGNFIRDGAPDFAIVGRGTVPSGANPFTPYQASVFDGARVAVEGRAASPTLQIWLGVPASSSTFITGALAGLRGAQGPLANWVVPLGDVNNDGRADMAVASGRGGDVVVYLGNAAPLQPTTEGPAPAAVHPAPRLIASTEHLPAATGWAAAAPWAADSLAVAPTAFGRVEYGREGAIGVETNDMPPSIVFAQPVAIGDFNGDGHGDFALPGAGGHASAGRIILGPVTVPDWDDIDELADFLLPVGAVLPDAWGDIDGDPAGTSDLVWAVNDGGKVRINIRFGGTSADFRDIGTLPDRSFLTGISWQEAHVNRPIDFNRGVWNRGVQLSVGDWNGDGHADVMVKGATQFSSFRDSRTLGVFSGIDIASASRSDYEDAVLFSVDLGFANDACWPGNCNWTRWAYSLDAQFVGDVDGDGRTDLVVASPVDYRDVGNIERRAIGGVYLFYGRPDGRDSGLGSLNSSARIDQGQGKAASLHRLGDVNGDGRADFAVGSYAQFGTSSIEENNFQRALNQVDVFLGSQSVAELRRVDSSFNGQFDAPGTFSRTTVTVGDFNADGHIDLAIGTPLRYASTDAGGYTTSFGLISLNLDGQVQVWFGDNTGTLWTGGAANAFRPASVTLTGRADELLGVLWNGPAADVDGDGIADLLIGRPGADRLLPSYVEDAGGFTLLRGFDGRPVLTAAQGLPQQPGSLPVLTQGYQAVTFAAGQAEVWFRVTTQGDGLAADGFMAYVPGRLTGDAYNGQAGFGYFVPDEPLTTAIVRLSADGASGTVLSSGRWSTLAGLPGGTYLVRVQRTDAAASAQAVLQAALPLHGRSLAAAGDSDRIFGDGGNDYLIGGSDIDRLYGGAGNDRFNFSYGGLPREGFEVRDAAAGVDTLRPFYGGPIPPQDRARQSDSIPDPVVNFAWRDLGWSLRTDLRLAANTPLRQSQLLGVTSLVVYTPFDAAPDMAGLELLQNLRTLWVMYAGGPGLETLEWDGLDGQRKSMRDLKNLQVLDVFGHSLTTLRVEDLPDRLVVLNVAGNQISSLAGLTGSVVADDDPFNGRYAESDGPIWLLGRQSGGLGNDFRFTDGSAASGGASVLYRMADSLAAGTYRVQLLVPSLPFNTFAQGGSFNNVELVVAHAGVPVYTRTFDQATDGHSSGPGLPWRTVGEITVPEGGFAGPVTIGLRLLAGETLLADGVRLQRTDSVNLPASLALLDLRGNRLPFHEYQAQIGEFSRDVSVQWMDALGFVEPTFEVPRWIETSAINGGFAAVTLPGSSGDLIREGALDQINGGSGSSIDYVEFALFRGDTVRIEMSPRAGGGSLTDPMLRLYRVTQDGSLQAVEAPGLDDRGGSSQGFWPLADVELDAGMYRLYVGVWPLTDGAVNTGYGPGNTGFDTSSNGSGSYNLYVTSASLRTPIVKLPNDPESVSAVFLSSYGTFASSGPSYTLIVSNREIGEATVSLRGSLQGRSATYDVVRVPGNLNGQGGAQTALVYGSVFDDVNADGLFGASDAPLEGFWVGVDTNGNGSLADEALRVGAWTDYQGRYIVDLSPFRAGGLPSTARLVVEDPSQRFVASALPTRTDIWGGLVLDDVNGPRDLGLTQWRMPAVVDLVDGEPLVLAAPDAVMVQGDTRTDLEARWLLFAGGADPGTSSPLLVLDGREAGPGLPHRVQLPNHPDGYRLVLALFEPGADRSLLANAVAVSSSDIRVRPSDTVRTISPAPLAQGSTLSVPAIETSYSIPVALQWQAVLSGPGIRVIDGTGDTVRLALPTAGDWQLRIEVRAQGSDGVLSVVEGRVSVTNLAPVVQVPAVSGTNPLEGSEVLIQPVVSDPGGDPLAFAWTVTGPRNQVYTGTDPVIRFVPLDNGTYRVSFTASDAPTNGDRGLSTTATRTVTVRNAAPVVALPTVVGRQEGRPIVLTANISDPGSFDTHSYAWTISDLAGGGGTVYEVTLLEPSGRVVQFTPPRDGSFAYTLVVTDNGGAQATRSGFINNVANVAPQLRSDSIVARNGREGEALTYDVDVVDVDAVTYAWSARRGSTEIATGSGPMFVFTPPNQGSYTVRVTVRDAQGASSTLSAPLTVANVAPAVAGIERLNNSGGVILPAGTSRVSVFEDARVRLRAVAQDVPADALRYEWSLVRAATNAVVLRDAESGATWQLPGLQAGLYMVRVAISDGDGGVTWAERELNVRNQVATWLQLPAAPQEPLVLGAARLQAPFSLRTAGTDRVDVLTAEVDYGDGARRTVQLNGVRDGASWIWTGALDHTYTTRPAAPEGWLVTIRVADEEGLAAEHALHVPVIDGPRLSRTGGAKLSVVLAEGDSTSFGTYRIRLDAMPEGTVLVEVIADGQIQLWRDAARTIPLTSVTFDARNWSTARTVYVTARDDAVAEDAVTTSRIVHRVTTTDPRVAFGLARGGGLPDLVVETKDNDAVGVDIVPLTTVNASGRLITDESGRTARFSLVLKSQPVADVLVQLMSSNVQEGVLSELAVRFTPEDWSTAREVVITGVGDRGATSTNDPYEIRLWVESRDPRYAALVLPSIGVVNRNVVPTESGSTPTLQALVAPVASDESPAEHDATPLPITVSEDATMAGEVALTPADISDGSGLRTSGDSMDSVLRLSSTVEMDAPPAAAPTVAAFVPQRESSITLRMGGERAAIADMVNPILGSARQRIWLTDALVEDPAGSLWVHGRAASIAISSRDGAVADDEAEERSRDSRPTPAVRPRSAVEFALLEEDWL